MLGCWLCLSHDGLGSVSCNKQSRCLTVHPMEISFLAVNTLTHCSRWSNPYLLSASLLATNQLGCLEWGKEFPAFDLQSIGFVSSIHFLGLLNSHGVITSILINAHPYVWSKQEELEWWCQLPLFPISVFFVKNFKFSTARLSSCSFFVRTHTIMTNLKLV